MLNRPFLIQVLVVFMTVLGLFIYLTNTEGKLIVDTAQTIDSIKITKNKHNQTTAYKTDEKKDYENSVDLYEGSSSIHYEMEKGKFLFIPIKTPKVQVTTDEGNTVRIPVDKLSFEISSEEEWMLDTKGYSYLLNGEVVKLDLYQYIIVGEKDEIIKIVKDMTNLFNKEFVVKNNEKEKSGE